MTRLEPLLLLVLATPATAADPPPKLDLYGDPLPAGAVARLGTLYLSASNCGPGRFSADGKTLHAATKGPAVVEWDAATGKRLRVTLLPGASRYTPELSADGSVAVVSLPDGIQRVVEVRTGVARMDLPNSVRAICVGPDGRFLAGDDHPGTGAGGRVRLWETASGRVHDLTHYPKHIAPHVRFSPDGGKLLALSTGRAECWALPDVTRLWHVQDDRIDLLNWRRRAAVFGPDGRRVLIPVRIDDVERVEVWDAATGKPAEGGKPFPAALASPTAFTPDGAAVLTCYTGDNRQEYGLWDLAAGAWRSRLPAHWGGDEVAFDLSGRTALTMRDHHGGNRFRLWDVATGKDLYPDVGGRGHWGGVAAVVFDRTGRRVVSAGDDGTVREWDAAGGRLLRTITTERANRLNRHSSPGVAYFAGRPLDGRAAVVGLAGWPAMYPSFQAFNLGTGSAGRVVVHGTQAIEGKFGLYASGRPARLADGLVRAPSPPLNNQMTGAPERVEFVDWDPATGRIVRTRSVHVGERPYPRRWQPVYFSPDGGTATDGQDLWHVAADRLIGSFRQQDREGRGEPTFSADGRFVAVRMVRVTPKARHELPDEKAIGVWVWDTVTIKPVARIDGRPDLMKLTPDGRFLLTLDETGIMAWELAAEGRRIVHHRADPRVMYYEGYSDTEDLDVAPDGQTAVTARHDGTCLVWDLSAAYRQAVTDPPTAADLAAVWDVWSKPDANPLPGLWRLADHPAESVPFLAAKVKELVKPTPGPTADDIRTAVGELDYADFATREAAEKRLIESGDLARPAVVAARPKASPEARVRLARVLAKLDAVAVPPLRPEDMPLAWSVAVLERANTADARAAIDRIAAGPPASRLTREAKAAADRVRP